MSSAPLLLVETARKAFGGLVAVNDVDFTVKQSELVGLIGPNGSGKTTMMNLISGALQPTSGVIRLQGEVISGMSAHKIAQRFNATFAVGEAVGAEDQFVFT